MGVTKARRVLPDECTQEIADKIIDRISRGQQISRIAKDMGYSYATIREWMLRHANTYFRGSSRAREIGYDYLAEECLKIADSKVHDPSDKRIMIDTRLRLLGLWARQKYGNNAVVEVRHSFSDLSPDELLRKVRELGARLGAEIPEHLTIDVEDFEVGPEP